MKTICVKCKHHTYERENPNDVWGRAKHGCRKSKSPSLNCPDFEDSGSEWVDDGEFYDD